MRDELSTIESGPHPLPRPRLVVLVRHAESTRNQAKQGSTYFADDEARQTVKGIPDHLIGLTPVGVAQDQATGRYLRDRFGSFDYVYHSGYSRTVQTADHILGAYSAEERTAMAVRRNAFIRERDAGYTYEMTEAEAEAAFPWLKDYWQTFGGFFACPPGGESLALVTQRVYLFLNMLFRDRAGQRVLVVTHGGTLRCFRFLLERWDYDQALRWQPGHNPRHCGVTIYEYDDVEARLLLREYNTVCYADETNPL